MDDVKTHKNKEVRYVPQASSVTDVLITFSRSSRRYQISDFYDIQGEKNIYYNLQVNNRKGTDNNYKFKLCTVTKIAKAFELVTDGLNLFV